MNKNFVVELDALSMHEVASKYIKPENGIQPRWFYSSELCDFYLLLDNSKIKNFHLAYEDTYFENAQDGSLKYGVINRDKVVDKMKVKSSELIQWQSRIPKEKQIEAKRVIENIQGLSVAEKLLILDYFSQVLIK